MSRRRVRLVVRAATRRAALMSRRADGRPRRRRRPRTRSADGARRRERLAIASRVHATTHASARGQRHLRGARAQATSARRPSAAPRSCSRSPSAPTAPIFLGRLGWTEIARLRVWARPLLAQAPAPAEHGPLRRSSATRLRRWPNHVVRDADHLNWRYVDSPRGYRAVRSDERAMQSSGGRATAGSSRPCSPTSSAAREAPACAARSPRRRGRAR